MDSSESNNVFVRADKVGLAAWDVEYAKRFCRDMLASPAKKMIEEEGRDWNQIDASKLEIKDVIATGTYGTVYRGFYDGQDVAVKVLDWGEDGRAETASLRASFCQEVSMCCKLDHPNITKFIGASMGNSGINLPSSSPSSKACCVIVEYLKGGTLKNYLIKNRRKKLAFNVVVQLASDIAMGLSYLHSNNIVHRDVKTENMLLDTKRTVKIADFGVARVEALNHKDMTGGTGTVNYMAPEVIECKPYDRKCDVYSFAICLWEIYCCEMPYSDITDSEISTGVVTKNLRPKIPKCCPKELANIMRRCWDEKPESRPEMAQVSRLLSALDTSKGGGMVPPGQNSSSFMCFSCFSPRGP